MTLSLSRASLCGININDRSIELVVIGGEHHEKTIITHGRVLLPDGVLSRGTILKEASFLRAIEAVKSRARIPNHRIRATVSVGESLVYPFALPHADTLPHEAIVRLANEQAKKQIPVDQNSLLLFLLTTHDSETGNMVYAIDKRVAKAYERILKKAHVTIDHIEPESIAIARSILPDVARTTTSVIDIGENVSHCITLHNGYPLISQTIPFGTTYLLRNTMGVVPESVLRQTSNAFAEQIATRLQEARQFLQTHVPTAHALHGIHIVGGGALLPNITELLQQALKKPVAVGVLSTPLLHTTLPNHEIPLYLHAIGSALRELHETSGLVLIPLVTDKQSLQHDFFHFPFSTIRSRMKTVLLAFFFVLLVILILLVLRATFA